MAFSTDSVPAALYSSQILSAHLSPPYNSSAKTIGNAIKYNVSDGWVHVSLNADYQYFYVRVEDSGIGIPKESQDLVFDRFYRVDKARSRQTGGTGLGLAIVQNIVLLHHGTIKLHSEEGTGTTFTVRIPLNYVG